MSLRPSSVAVSEVHSSPIPYQSVDESHWVFRRGGPAFEFGPRAFLDFLTDDEIEALCPQDDHASVVSVMNDWGPQDFALSEILRSMCATMAPLGGLRDAYDAIHAQDLKPYAQFCRNSLPWLDPGVGVVVCEPEYFAFVAKLGTATGAMVYNVRGIRTYRRQP